MAFTGMLVDHSLSTGRSLPFDSTRRTHCRCAAHKEYRVPDDSDLSRFSRHLSEGDPIRPHNQTVHRKEATFMPAFALVTMLALLQSVTATPPGTLVAEVGTLAASSDNDGRFEALTSLLRAHNLAFTVEPFTIEKAVGAEPRTHGRNIVVSLGEGAEEIVVGAHYDAIRIPDGSLSHGAVDNGAACVMLLHLAETLRADPLRVRVKIVWFDMEELGMLGSARYVEAHATDPIRAMVNFDIDGYGDTVLFAPPPGGENAPLRRAFLDTCAAEEIDCVRFPRLPYGDDRSFGNASRPTLSVGLLPPTEMHQMWLLMNAGVSGGLVPGTLPTIFRTIHTAEDVLAKVDGASIARVQRLAVALVRRLSSGQP
jgi:hypothetical protein